MARRIADEGFPLTLWARSPSSLEPFADTTAAVASSPADLGAGSDIVGVCVTADSDVRQVLLGPDGLLAGMAPGGLLAIHSTIHPDTCHRLAAEAGEHGVAMVDAPVSGGGAAAAERRLLVMVGGAEADVSRCRPVLETFADPLLHLGPLGSGLMAKLLNNLVFTAQLTLALETFEFAERLGMDPLALAGVLASGSGGSRVAGILAASGFSTAGVRQSVGLLRKDVGIMVDLAAAADLAAPANLQALAEQTLSVLSEPPR